MKDIKNLRQFLPYLGYGELKKKNMTHTKGNIIIEEIKIGDVHYEFEYGCYIKSTVISLPVRDEKGTWKWQSKTDGGEIINYAVNEKYSHYGPNLYDHMAYMGCKQLK